MPSDATETAGVVWVYSCTVENVPALKWRESLRAVMHEVERVCLQMHVKRVTTALHCVTQ
jgi:hypothetical protein